MIVLGVDLGERRVGLAICDAEGMIASPFRTENVRSTDDALQAVVAAVGETGAERVVLGYPRNMNGRPGPKARESEAFAEALKESGTPVALWDERLTTAEAERSMKDAKMSRKQRKSVIDAVAAQRILQSWLDANRGRG